MFYDRPRPSSQRSPPVARRGNARQTADAQSQSLGLHLTSITVLTDTPTVIWRLPMINGQWVDVDATIVRVLSNDDCRSAVRATRVRCRDDVAELADDIHVMRPDLGEQEATFDVQNEFLRLVVEGRGAYRVTVRMT